jgi:hypothetical protein
MAITIVAGIFAAFFAASGVWNVYYALFALWPAVTYNPSELWFAARQLATSVGFIGVAWIVWRQPRRLARSGFGRVLAGIDSRLIAAGLAVLFGFLGFTWTSGYLVQRFWEWPLPVVIVYPNNVPVVVLYWGFATALGVFASLRPRSARPNDAAVNTAN